MWSDDDDDALAQEDERRAYWRQEQQKLLSSLDSRHVTGRSSGTTYRRHSPRYSESNRSHSDSSQKPKRPFYTLFVNNLPLNTCEIDLEDIFGDFGKVHSVFIQHSRSKTKEGSNATFGFVRMLEESDAKRAINGLNSSILKGKSIHVKNCYNPLTEQQVEHHRQKRAAHRRTLCEEDDQMLWQLIERYTAVLAHSPDDAKLPDLSDLLGAINEQPNRLVPPYLERDYVVCADLEELKKSFAECLASGLSEGESEHGGRNPYCDSDTEQSVGESIPPPYYSHKTASESPQKPDLINGLDIPRASTTPERTTPSIQDLKKIPLGRGKGSVVHSRT